MAVSDMSAFEVNGPVLRPDNPTDPVRRERAAQVLAAFSVGLDPVEITECLRTNEWPDEVQRVTARPMQLDELGHVADVLAAVLGH